MEEVIFEDYNVKFTEKDIINADKNTLEKCKKRLQETLSKLSN